MLRPLLIAVALLQAAPLIADEPVCEPASTAAVNQLIASYGVAVTVSSSATPDPDDHEVGGTPDNGCVIVGAASDGDTIIVYGTDTTTSILLQRYTSRRAIAAEAEAWSERPFHDVVWGEGAVAFIHRY